MSRTSDASMRLGTTVDVNGASVIQWTTLCHFIGERHYADHALKDGREFVAKLTERLDDLEAAMAAEPEDES